MEEEQHYDVALWRFFPSLFPEPVAFVFAVSPLAAIVLLMEGYGLRKVQHATARHVCSVGEQILPAGPIHAYNVIRLYENGMYVEEDTTWRRSMRSRK